MLTGLCLWAMHAMTIKTSVPIGTLYIGFRSYTNCHIYMAYWLMCLYIVHILMIVARFVASFFPSFYSLRYLGGGLTTIIKIINSNGLMAIPLITEMFVTVTGHYAVGYYTVKFFHNRDPDKFARAKLRLQFQIFFHISTSLCILATEFQKHRRIAHDPKHVIDRKTFKENFLQFLPLYRPGGPYGGDPSTWADLNKLNM